MIEVLDNDTTAREKVSLNGLGMTKGQFEGVSMMLKTGMKVDQYYTSFKNVPPIPQKDVNYQYITIVAWTGVKSPPPPLPVNSKGKVEKDPTHPSHPIYVVHGYLGNIIDHHS